MTAHEELAGYVRSMSGAASLLPAHGWQFGEFDPARARRAAVLILFGLRDDAAAGGVPVATANRDELDVLFVLRASSLKHHPGQVAFPGGAIDPDDPDEAAAALREAREETGIDSGGVEVLGCLPEVGLPVSNFMVSPVIGWWARESPVHAVDTAESELVFRVPVSTLLDPAHRRTAVVRRSGFTSRTPAFLAPEAVIWGFTAMLLDAVFDGLDWTLPWDHSVEIPAPL